MTTNHVIGVKSGQICVLMLGVVSHFILLPDGEARK